MKSDTLSPLANATYHNIDELFSKNNLSDIDGIILLGTEYYHEPRESFYKLPVPLVVLDGFFPRISHQYREYR